MEDIHLPPKASHVRGSSTAATESSATCRGTRALSSGTFRRPGTSDTIAACSPSQKTDVTQLDLVIEKGTSQPSGVPTISAPSVSDAIPIERVELSIATPSGSHHSRLQLPKCSARHSDLQLKIQILVSLY